MNPSPQPRRIRPRHWALGALAFLSAAMVAVAISTRAPGSGSRLGVTVRVRRAAQGDTNAMNALRRFGTDDLPTLCRMATNSASGPLERRIASWGDRLPKPFRQFLPDPSLKAREAMYAVQAVVAVDDWGPHFARVVRTGCDDPMASAFVADAGRRILRSPSAHAAPDVVAALAAGLTNASPWTQYHAVAALGLLGPGASNALPALRRRMSGGGRTVAQHAAHAIWRIAGERREPLETLLASVGSWDEEVLKTTRMRLRAMAPKAADAMPADRVLLRDNPRAARTPQGFPSLCGAGGPEARRFVTSLETSPDADLAEAAKAAHARLDRAARAAGIVPE